MKKIVIIVSILNSLLFANQVTKEDLIIMQNNIIKVIEVNNKNLENQIKAVKTDLENQIKGTNQRIDGLKTDLENQIKGTNQRIDGLKTDLENQIKGTNQRIDDTNKRIDDLYGVLFALMAGIFALIGFIMWDRRSMIEKTKSEITTHTKEYYTDKNITKDIIEILREYSKKDKDLQNILSRHNLTVS